MKKIILVTAWLLLGLLILPPKANAAAGIFPSGSGTKSVGETFTVYVTASGATFNAFQGTISTSGSVSVSSVSAGSADTWMSKPSIGGTFSGALLGRTATSLTLATIKLHGNSTGSGSLTVSNVVLKNGATTVSNSGGTVSFKFIPALDLPGAPTVTSSTHPNQEEAYEETSVILSWNQENGVTGFAYLVDEADSTTPESSVTSAETSATYNDLTVGTHYFHIKALKADGWGSTTHFKINIKEPDAKVDEALAKPENIEITKGTTFVNDVTLGKVSGIIIKGKVVPGYNVNIILTPPPLLPEGKSYTTTSDLSSGEFEFLIDFPISSGFYKLTVQGQLEKVLTPMSDEIRFEISQKDGGSINIITDGDREAPKTEELVKGTFLAKKYSIMYYLVFTLILAILVLSVIEIRKIIFKKKRPAY